MAIEQWRAEAAIPPEERCTFVTVNAIFKYFGLPPADASECPITGIDVLDALRSRGLKITVEWKWALDVPGGRARLKHVLERFSDGVFYVVTPGHAMALIHGELVDTAVGTDRRGVAGVYRITK